MNMFVKNGPYTLEKYCPCQPISLGPALYHWSEIMHVLYIDSPVGSGFSFTKNPSGFASTSDDVVNDLYSAITQLFQIFPEYQKSELYIVGESYSGKYAPLLAYLISSKSSSAVVEMNLKGVVIGNGWLDPLNMIGYSEVLFSIGLIDLNTKNEFKALESTIKSLLNNDKSMLTNETYIEAFNLLQNYFPVRSTVESSLVEDTTGFRYFGNYLNIQDEEMSKYLLRAAEFLNQPNIRAKLHVGDRNLTAFNDSVFERLKLDLLKPIGPKLGTVMDNYRVLMYNGQLDLTCSYHLTTKILQNITWGASKMFKKAQRKKWYVEGELAGYVKTAGNFTEVLVRDAGLQVAGDRPLWAWDLIKKFTHNMPLA